MRLQHWKKRWNKKIIIPCKGMTVRLAGLIYKSLSISTIVKGQAFT